MVVKIVPNDNANPPGKLADAELHFDNDVMAGLKLVGFAVWERRDGSGRRRQRACHRADRLAGSDDTALRGRRSPDENPPAPPPARSASGA